MKHLTTFIALLIVGVSYAQNHVFTVLATKGNNSIISTTSTTLAQAGDKLQHSDKITVAKNGYIGLLHKSGQTLEVRDEKTVSIQTLENKIKNTTVSTSSKYANFLFNNTKKTKNNYNITAAVERGGATLNMIANTNTLYIKEIPLTIYWTKNQKNDNIKPTLKDFSIDEATYEVTQNDTIATINFSKIPQTTLKFEIENATNNRVAHTILSPVESKKSKQILLEYNQLLTTIDTSKATDLLILASFFDANDLPQYTVSTLLKIIQIEPTIPEYQNKLANYTHYQNK